MRPIRPRAALATAAAVAAGVLVPLTLSAAPAHAGVLLVKPTDTIQVTMRGNGHGHGLSQYGARGAAEAGLSYPKIVHFYYPHTRLKRLAPSAIRVRLSGFGKTTEVGAYSRLTVSGVSGVLPTAGVRRYRLVADSGSGLTLQQLRSAKGSTWRTYRSGLASQASFHRTNGHALRLWETDRTSTFYRGSLRAVRAAAHGSSAGVYTVNRISLDRYTAGVVPREMPASWERAAVRSQAVAARTYGRYGVEHPQSASYDLCDSTQCQVYGGLYRYDSNGHQVWSDYWPAASATSNYVLTYKGATIFSQFSASDGGWTVDGGQPYLTAHADPYDHDATGNPYVLYSKRVRVSTIAAYFGLATVTRIAITKRDGHGAWGGRVTAGNVTGTTSGRKSRQLNIDGFDLQFAVGAGTTWLSLSSV